MIFARFIEVQGRYLDSDEERKDGWGNAEPRILIAAADDAADDHDNWMLRVEVGGAVGTKYVNYQADTGVEALGEEGLW